MGFKSKIAFFSALLVLLSSGSLPASAAAVSPAALSWSTLASPPNAAPTTATDLTFLGTTAVAQIRYSFMKFTSSLAVGDAWAVAVSVVRPAGSQVSVTDSNGSAAGAQDLFSGQLVSNWGTPVFSAGTGLITATVVTAFSSTSFTRIGSFSLTPDVAGDYEIVLTAMTDSGSGWQPLSSVTQKFSMQAYDVIAAPATVVRAASFATGVELDADGNIYWLDNSASKIFRTDIASTTTQFSAAPSGSTKLFVEGAWLYVQAGDRVSRLALNNSNPSALPSLIQGQGGMFPSSSYSQAIGYSRISGQNYIAMAVPKTGEVWRYPVEAETVSVSSYSVTGNVASLMLPVGHGFAAGDVVRTLDVGSTSGVARTITESTTTSIKFAFSSVNVASTATPIGRVAKSIGASTLLATIPNGVRGMAPSLDGRYLYLAYGSGKQILRLDTQNLGAGTQVFADLNAVSYAPDDMTFLNDGSLLVSAYSPQGVLWHISAAGKLLSKINMTLAGANVGNGYDLRMSPDGSKIYLAAQSTGFLSLALSRPLIGSSRGTSNLIAPSSGPIISTVAAASVFDSFASNISTSSALLRGSVNPNGAGAQAQFRWSSDPTFPVGSTQTSTVQNLNGSAVQSLEHQATGLTANTTYYFQIMAGSGSANEVFGGVRSFSTSALPGITAVSVNTGSAIGGTSVQLTIQGFTSAPTVKVGGVLATNVVFTAPGTLTFITPPQAGTGVLIESGSLAAYAGFIYSAPQITAISPVSGVEAGGFAVTVSGSNFTGATGLTVAGIATTFSFVNDGSLTFTAPANSLGGKTVQITAPSGTAAIQLTYEPALPNPAPTQSAPSATPTPSNPAPEAPTVRAPRAVISVTLSKGVVNRKSRIVLTLPEATQDSPINSVRVQLRNALGEITQTLVIPLREATATLDFEVPLAYGDYDVSVSTFNAAGYSSEVVNVGGIVAKDTILGISPTKWPTIKGVKMPSKLLFEPNSAKLTAASEKSLLAIREKLRGFEGRILISGFAAKFGPSPRGKQISAARALAVAKKLKALGVDSWIEYHGHGQLPSSASGMRRVDVSLIETPVLKK